ncbi:hypothetical protein [Haloarcula salinisoli]|uniref:Uncharacterized protein n=1 Tax=Haloarcula salinisoli TaxID=2487746 RepID=A0A8J8C8Y0_9EURY|nr:hypothetical protein [Halomicroarcula salinisoli]MBX0304737.1 hypothetical protein [Halomicroarcula salinisoli]
MDRFFGYAGLLVLGLTGTTISSAVAGDPVPVVIPGVAAFVLVALHHVATNERGDGDLDDNRDGLTDVYPDGHGQEGHQ